MGTDGGRCLPLVLVEDILVRLPVKSLLRFKCVCKDWQRIIKSPNFIIEQCNFNRKKAPKIMVYDHSAPDDSPDTITLISEDGLLEKLPPEERVRGTTRLLGSIDGLFLVKKGIYDDVSLSLWNPATKEVRHLPDPNFNLQFIPLDEKSCRNQIGFGLDPVTHDYKVFWSFFYGDSMYRERVHAAVYSCSKDSWKILQLENTYYNSLLYSVNALGNGYLNGTYYWCVLMGFNSNILSFDFANEEFGEIEGPDPAVAGRSFNNSRFFLILLHDHSIALLTNPDIFNFEIWVMIQPGLWNKLFAFQCFTYSPYITCWNPSTIIYITKRSRLVSYDVTTGQSRRLGFRHPTLRPACYIYSLEGSSVHIYKETLVTIKPQFHLNN